MSKINFVLIPFLLALTGLVSTCSKSSFLSKGNLSFSTDTLVFDTVFTTIGSTTKKLKIYNRESKTLNIDEIQLMGGSSSVFRMNVDGLAGPSASSLTLEAGDSLYIFVEVTLKVNGQQLPMVVEDSIRFRTNGKDQYVQLAVWGQDAYFHYNDLNEGTWANDKPHVIYGYAAVDSAKTLTIQKNTSIFLHKNALLYVYKGTLNVQGEKGAEVVFRGDRLEADYDNVSGQYYGIYFQKARPSTINYAIINNGTSGIHLYSKDANSSGYTLTLSNTKIKNCARYGVFIYSGAKVKAENCIVSKSGTHALLVLGGGDFFFNYCNLIGSASGTPAVGISNFYKDVPNNVINVGSIDEGKIYNSVIYGSQLTELVFDTIQNAAINLNFDIRNCLIKRQTPATESYYSSIFWNNNPFFIDAQKDNFLFSSTSVLNNNGNANFWIPFDINQTARNPSTPDIGALELE